MSDQESDLAQWQARAREWLRSSAPPRDSADVAGLGSVAVFDNLTFEQEQEQLAAAAAWQRAKLAAGYGAITWSPEFGGAGLAPAYEEAFGREEAQVAVPRKNELFSVTLELVAPTVAAFGTPAQQRELIPRLLAAELFVCQLFSEPGAGSDLASLSLRAERRDEGWVLNGQKLWTSYAQYADFGVIVARTDPTVAKHKGLTYFWIDMKSPGVTVRPVKLMTGDATVNEVFFDNVRIPDSQRLGGVGEGFAVAMETLFIERYTAADESGFGPPAAYLAAYARALATDAGPAIEDGRIRREIASAYRQ